MIRKDWSKSGFCRPCWNQQQAGSTPTATTSSVPPDHQVHEDREKKRLQSELTLVKAKYEAALVAIEQRDAEMTVFADLRAGFDDSLSITPREGSGTSEATVVIAASDWHAEEIVVPAQVNGLNEFNLEIADQRITRFFQASTNLMKKHLNPGVHIHDVVMLLGGDFITNDIHEELVENVALKPTEAIIWVQNRLVAGINFYLTHTPYTYTFVCKVGNHSRTTKKTHFSQENGHSLEYLMYRFLANEYRNEPRVRFVIDGGYLSYMDIYTTTVRFHHGHAVKYNGGVGGLTIPTNKSIASWNDGRRAHLDVFGHFHTSFDGGKFIANGSLIGYNSFAVSIKAPYERPQQSLFLIDKRRGRTCHWPILVGEME